MSHPILRIAPDLVPVVGLGVLHLVDIHNVELEPRLDAPLAETETAVRRCPPEDRAAVRQMYWRVGIDPTRRRPSSEALLRRVLRGDRLPRINALVDVCNWCSLQVQLPYGLYDLEQVEGAIELRLGRPGEQYQGIRKDAVHVGGRLTLADEIGPFGNPTSDSARTMVSCATTQAVAVIFSPRETGLDALSSALELTSRRAVEFAGAREAARFVV